MFKPMKAPSVSVDPAKVIYPCLASYKMDGIRAIISGIQVLSCNLKLIPNQHTQNLLGRMDLSGLDGELIVGSPCAGDVMGRTSSGVMSRAGEPDVHFYVFDHVSDHAYQQRLEYVRRQVTRHAGKTCPLVFVEHRLIHHIDELLAMEGEALQTGYEGLMLRSLDGPYREGRCTAREGYLFKLKRFSDSEAKVLRIEEAEHNTNEAKKDELGRTKRSSHASGKVPAGMLGTIIGKDIHSGVEVRIAPGKMTRDERIYWWEHQAEFKKKIVKYKFFAYGVKDKPRFPGFIGFRDPRDLTK
jgi:DNA ligase-1